MEVLFDYASCCIVIASIIIADLGHRNGWLMMVSDGDRELYSQWLFQPENKSAIVAAAEVE